MELLKGNYHIFTVINSKSTMFLYDLCEWIFLNSLSNMVERFSVLCVL